MKKHIVVAGSLAYDRIMNFPEKFSDHILPDQIHNLNVCFQVNGVTENFGGTAGNIAYALKLMGEDPVISATIGSDHHNYYAWLDQNRISREAIKAIPGELTAGAYITTDTGNNQITGFNPGAMKHSSSLDIAALGPATHLLLVSPGNLEDMIDYPKKCQAAGIDYVFDPGQALPMLRARDLIEVINGCLILIVNDYEFNLIEDKTGLSREELLALAKSSIVTLGEKGSVVYTAGGQLAIPCFPATRVVDPTGAGDAYRGGLLSGLINGCDLRESATLGSVCASFAVESRGTQVYRFSQEEFAQRRQGTRQTG